MTPAPSREPPTTDPVEIRIASLDELEACRALEEEAFDFAPTESIPGWVRHMTDSHGGITLTAHVAGQLVGFSYALPAFEDTGPYLFSLGLVVKRGHRSSGIGRSLKLRQRHEAVARGYRVMRWTIGSLNSHSFHLALTVLGARAIAMHPTPLDALQSRVYMDEVLCEWDLVGRPARVARPEPRRDLLHSVEIPWDHRAMASADPDLAAQWRQGVAAAMRQLFARGMYADEVILDRRRRRAWLAFSTGADRQSA
jgi:predicted GNAT superfamily acetyltransferase